MFSKVQMNSLEAIQYSQKQANVAVTIDSLFETKAPAETAGTIAAKAASTIASIFQAPAAPAGTIASTGSSGGSSSSSGGSFSASC